MQDKQKNSKQKSSQGGSANNKLSASFRQARQRLGQELQQVRQRTATNTQRYTANFARPAPRQSFQAPVRPLETQKEPPKHPSIVDLQTFEDQKTLTGHLRPPENLAGLGLANSTTGDTPTVTFHSGQAAAYLKDKGQTEDKNDFGERATVAFRPSYDEPTNNKAGAATAEYATRPMSAADVRSAPHASFLAGNNYVPLPVPQNRASLPVVSSTAIKRKKSRRFQFIAPPESGPQLFAALMSAVVVVVLIIFTLIYLRSFLDRSNSDKFSIVFATLGEGLAYAHTAVAKDFSQHLAYNYQQQSDIPNLDMRIDSSVLTNSSEGSKIIQQYNSDVLVWGQFDQPTKQLWLNLEMQPNGPLDTYDWNYQSSRLAQLNSMVFTMTAPTDWTQPEDFTQLAVGLYHYYNGDYADAVSAFSTLLVHTPADTANELYLRFLRGNAFYAQGNYKSAEVDFESASTIDQSIQNNSVKVGPPITLPLSWIINNEGVTQLALNNQTQALTDFQQATNSDNSLGVAYLNLARQQAPTSNQPLDVSTRANLYSQIISNLTKASDNGQGEVKAAALLQRSQLYYQQNNLDGATDDAQQAIAIDPALAPAYDQLGQAYLQSYLSSDIPEKHQDLLNKAYDTFQKGVDIANQQHDQNYDKYSNLCNDQPIATNNTQASVGSTACIYKILLQTQVDNLNYGLARATFERGLLQGTDEGSVLDRLDRAVTGQKLWIQQARDRFLVIVQARPNFADGYYYLARTEAFTNQGDWEIDFNKAISLNPNQYDYYKALADSYVQHGDVDKAIGKYEQYLKLSPNNLDAHLNLAALYYQEKQYALAAAQADQVVKATPGNYEAELVAGESYSYLKNYSNAIQRLQTAISLDSTKAEPHYYLGLVFDNAGQIDNAIDQLQVAINFAANDPTMLANAYYQRGLLLEQKGNNQDALTDYQQAVKYDNKNADAYLHLGDMYDKLNQNDKALDAYNSSANLKSGLSSAIAYYKIGLQQEATTQYDKAVKSFNAALALWPSMNSALLERGKTELAQGSVDTALSTINDYISKAPNSADGYTALGKIQRTKGDFNSAVTAYTKSITLQPQSAEAHLGLGIAYEKLGKYPQAMTEVNKALQINPNYSDAYTEQGIILVAQGQSEAALKSYQEALQYNRNNPDAYSHLGDLYLSHAQISVASDDYNKAVQLNPNDANAHYQLGMIKAHNYDSANSDTATTSTNISDINEAIAELQTAVKIQANWPEAWYQLGRLYERKPSEADAEKAFKNAIAQSSSFIEAHYELGNVYLTENNRDGALAEYQTAIQQAQAQKINFLPAYYQEGQVYESNGKLDLARTAYTQVINTATAADADLKQEAQQSLKRINGQS